MNQLFIANRLKRLLFCFMAIYSDAKGGEGGGASIRACTPVVLWMLQSRVIVEMKEPDANCRYCMLTQCCGR